MQIAATLVPTTPIQQTHTERLAPSPIAPAASALPAPIESAVDGAAALSAPIVDFPGIEAGQRFNIVKGSKVNVIGVRGTAEVVLFDPQHAIIRVDAGRFGFKAKVDVEIQRIDDEIVHITTKGHGLPDMSIDGRIVEQRPNYSEFQRIDDPSERTIISHDGNGNLVVDTAVPGIGQAHLLLERA